MAEDERVCILGMGFIGLTLANVLAEAGVEVYGVDVDPEVIATLRAGRCHFFEPGLAELVARHANARLKLFGAIPDATCSYYVLCVATPIDPETGKPRLEAVESATASLVPVLKRGDTVILRSTVPVGTSRTVVMGRLERATGLRAGADFHFGFVPERTVEGNALREQREVPQIIGPLDAASRERILRLVRRFNRQQIIVPDLEHAELCKIIDNTYRDVTFAYANQMAMISEALGLDFDAIREACNRDYPRNRIPRASPGVGGPCLTKDPHILLDVCDRAGVDGGLIRAAREVNERIVAQLAGKILARLEALGRPAQEAKVFVMGFAFKGHPETSDVRASTTLDLVAHLAPSGVRLFGYDALVEDAVIAAAGVEPCSIAAGFRDADAVVVMTSHASHRGLPLAELAATARSPLVFVDCWRLYSEAEVAACPGVLYSSVGRH